MADEVRRSGRANKGHHTKNQDALDEPTPSKLKPKGKPDKKPPGQAPAQAQAQAQGQAEEQAPDERAQSAQSEEQQEEEDAIYRCVCGDQREIRGREMIMCDRCEAWQHNKCLGLPEGDYWTDKTYLCEQCRPEDHQELLAAIERGEKPWNRKKGSKAPRPRFRPSDVGTDAGSDKNEDSAPQAPPVQAPASDPATNPHTAAPDGSNGHAQGKVSGPKPSKKVISKRQPESPGGEKRTHDAIAEKDGASSKRRKSSAQHHEKPSPQDAMITDPASLPEKQKLFVDKLITSLSAMINQASGSRGYRIPDGDTPSSVAIRLVMQINHAAVTHHGGPTDNSSPYVHQFRSILFNIKKNAILVDRLLDGSLNPDDIATMATEEMASEEKQREYAAMREANEKQMILTEEPGPRLRKTHKGEEIVGESSTTAEQEYRPPERDLRDVTDEDHDNKPQSPKEDGNQVVELPEDVTAGSALALDTSGAQNDGARRPSTAFDINSVFDKVRSPQQDQKVFLQRRQSSIKAQHTPQQGPGHDADIDRLLKDEDNDVEMSGYTADPTIVWQGKLDMQSLGPFDVVARFVAGGDLGQVIPWQQLLTATLPIAGRIESQRGDEYIRGLASSTRHDVGVLLVHPVTAEGRVVHDHLFNYFHPRDRWGVVPVDKLESEAMQDLYVIPIEPGGGELPPFLNMLEYCAIETPRPAPMLLLALVAKLPDTKPQFAPSQSLDRHPPAEMVPGHVSAQAPPTNGPTNGPSPSPINNPHGPQYSPVQPVFPPGQSFGSPYPQPPQGHNGQTANVPLPNAPPHHRIPKAIEILGPHIDAPVIVQVLSQVPDTTAFPEVLLGNLRHIMDNVPAARTDLTVFNDYMKTRNEASAQK